MEVLLFEYEAGDWNTSGKPTQRDMSKGAF